MFEALHPQRLLEARAAILDRFRWEDTYPGGNANRHMFQQESQDYRGGYFAAAMRLLIDEGHIESVMDGLMYRLTKSGYEEARS